MHIILKLPATIIPALPVGTTSLKREPSIRMCTTENVVGGPPVANKCMLMKITLWHHVPQCVMVPITSPSTSTSGHIQRIAFVRLIRMRIVTPNN